MGRVDPGEGVTDYLGAGRSGGRGDGLAWGG